MNHFKNDTLCVFCKNSPLRLNMCNSHAHSCQRGLGWRWVSPPTYPGPYVGVRRAVWCAGPGGQGLPSNTDLLLLLLQSFLGGKKESSVCDRQLDERWSDVVFCCRVNNLFAYCTVCVCGRSSSQNVPVHTKDNESALGFFCVTEYQKVTSPKCFLDKWSWFTLNVGPHLPAVM